MSNINQLLAKALSTASEEEAVSCLRMARKKGGRLEDSTSSDYNGHDAKYWYDKAATYYTKAKEKANGLSLDQQDHLFQMYKNEAESVTRLRREKYVLEGEVRKLKNRPTGAWKLPVIFIQGAIILALVQLISVHSVDGMIESTQGDKHGLESVH